MKAAGSDYRTAMVADAGVNAGVVGQKRLLCAWVEKNQLCHVFGVDMLRQAVGTDAVAVVDPLMDFGVLGPKVSSGENKQEETRTHS